MLVGFGKYSLSQLSKDLLARSSRAVRWGNVAKPTNIFKWNVTSFLMTFMYLCVRWFMMQHYKSRAMYSHCLPMKTVSGPWKRQCDVTLPTPRTSFSFTPQFGISLFSCFSSPPYSPVALCVFNRIFSPKKKYFHHISPNTVSGVMQQDSRHFHWSSLVYSSIHSRHYCDWGSWKGDCLFLNSALHYSIHWPKTPSHTVHRFCDPQGTTHGIN